MVIILNGETIDTQAGATIAVMLAQAGYADMLVAVAVNGAFVPRSDHDHVQLAEGDAVDIVAPMQGG